MLIYVTKYAELDDRVILASLYIGVGSDTYRSQISVESSGENVCKEDELFHMHWMLRLQTETLRKFRYCWMSTEHWGMYRTRQTGRLSLILLLREVRKHTLPKVYTITWCHSCNRARVYISMGFFFSPLMIINCAQFYRLLWVRSPGYFISR